MTSESTSRHLGVIGTGLIGASIGMRAKRHAHVLGADSSERNAQEARERGAIDEIVTREELYERCEIVVIALPPNATCEELRRLAGAHHTCKLIVDVASVKAPIVEAARGVKNFVATHPLAGNEGSGPGAASPDLFEGRSWAYVPSGDAELDAQVRAFIESLGAEPFACDAERHDRIVAVTSHLPQVIAWVLVERMRGAGDDYERFCGPAGREFLRLARARPELWKEIIELNAHWIETEARAVARELPDSINRAARGRDR